MFKGETARKWMTVVGLFFGYTIQCSLRKLFATSLPDMSKDLGFTKTEIGKIFSYFSLAFGCTKLITGLMSDFVSSKSLVCVGLLSASFVFFLVSETTSYSILCVLVFCSGISMGFGKSVSVVILLY